MTVPVWLLPLLGFGGPILVAVVAGIFANRSAKRTNQTQVQANQFTQNFEFQKYLDIRIDKAVADKTSHLEKRIGTLEKILKNVWGDLDKIRDAFKEYIGKVISMAHRLNVEPPEIEDHIRELLTEGDFDGTLTKQQARDILDGNIPEEPDFEEENYG